MTPPADLSGLEHSLWCAETRYDRALMEATFAPDFYEFGRSGRRYARAELIFDTADARDIPATLHALTVTSLSDQIALVTYISELRTDPPEWANRASLWDRSSGRWQLRFHQGTPCEAPEGPSA